LNYFFYKLNNNTYTIYTTTKYKVQSTNHLKMNGVSKTSEMVLIHTKSRHHLECSVCYKSINATFFKCSNPCNKVFHVNCIEQMIEQTRESAYEMDTKAHHRCCYCRRDIDINKVRLNLFARFLQTLESGYSYDASTALKHVQKKLKKKDKPFDNSTTESEDDDDDDDESSYEIYQLTSIQRIEKPKQSKNAEFKNIAKNPSKNRRHIVIKQNIGGRRR